MADPRLTVSQVDPRLAPGAVRARASLTAVFPAGLSWRVELGADPRVLGRDGGPGVAALDHRTVSRRHLEISWDGGRHVATELGSRNGSRLDGRRLDERAQAVGEGAVLQLGDVFLVYEGETDATDDAPLPDLPGRSAAARALRAAVARAAADPSPALIVGETGTGKEWVARELHRAGGRSGPMVAVNCAALGPTLVESQLFGHVKGAFTGATGEHRGLFRAADGGTLFLDEIGELPLELQPKLLRALQDHEVLAVGATRTVAVDVRVVAATNRALGAAVSDGGFRRDLYARLAMWEIAVPPLRARRADILDWLLRLHHAWRDARPGARAAPIELLPDAVETLLLHPWPDNLRGVDRLVHRLATATHTAAVGRAELPAWLRDLEPAPAEPTAEPAPARGRRETPARAEIERAYHELGGSVRALARHFGRDRKQIYRWLAALGLKKGDDPEED
jgi:transcriptional regulator with GAF, ATPase, and Fis domain